MTKNRIKQKKQVPNKGCKEEQREQRVETQRK